MHPNFSGPTPMWDQGASDDGRRASMDPGTIQQLGGKGPIPFVRYPFFPTSPFQSTNPNVGHIARFYKAELLSTDTDYAVGTEVPRNVRFDIPCTIVAFNATAIKVDGTALPVGWDRRDTFSFYAQWGNGEKIHTATGLGSLYAGSSERPGEVGGAGWIAPPGSTLTLNITPRLAGLRIEIAVHTFEYRGHASFTQSR